MPNANHHPLLILWLLAASAFAGPVIDLDTPGAMASLRRSNADHFERVQGVVAGLSSSSADTAPIWLRTRYRADDLVVGSMTLTSYPPQRKLALTLDDTRYRLTWTLRDAKPQVLKVPSPGSRRPGETSGTAP
ncbi:hypothetical protein [Variovorax saccharolyticus]|uniref:hypothetical protein n=1 Tax=Variovorax saccharolyticus TaxID=3053516 RepID=UPI0025755930|nr:hypothetical protein [Variovorax sp. J31P216]MDM0026554.1 hypothetical protein [Variovorax sp. J31P216]